MEKEKWFAVAIGGLAVSILIGSYVIAGALEQVARARYGDDSGQVAQAIRKLADVTREVASSRGGQRDNVQGDKEYMYMSDAAQYLGMDYKELSEFVNRAELGIPYIAINNKYIFYKDALDDWLKDARIHISMR
ncbi:hypothetical protein LOK74_14860 [Brevibacillus humidisoli]|uniref:hypothetical protein n=1 Tax=Brevibacillus humidisoli TaxID=2895522 RepID=UPI001E3AEFA5|nr:hypothetical protein [Brevibacillus humidisoli]UFJ39348.1 hypothetical protein LOK74_14860 [Brevibacillus humidisoli]